MSGNIIFGCVDVFSVAVVLEFLALLSTDICASQAQKLAAYFYCAMLEIELHVGQLLICYFLGLFNLNKSIHS